MDPSVTAASTSTAPVGGLVLGALITTIGSVLVGRMSSRATVTAARVSAGPRRSSLSRLGWIVALALLGGIVGMVVTALWVGSGGSGGGEAVQAGRTSSDGGGAAQPTSADPGPEGAVEPAEGKVWHGSLARTPTTGMSADPAPCPGREQLSRADRLGDGSFTVVEIPADGSVVVLQVAVLGNSGELVITICQDPVGAYWYLSRVVDDPLVGVVTRATPVPDGLYADVTFQDGPVRFVVRETGVAISATEELALARVICRGEDLPGALDSLDDVGRCTPDAVSPWDV